MTFGLFNVIIAIYVESTVAAAKFNELRQKQHRLTDKQVFAERSLELCEVIWSRHPDNFNVPLHQVPIEELRQVRITPVFFLDLTEHKPFREILPDLDIADEEQLDLFDTLDVDGSGFLDFGEPIHGISKLRGDARRSDIISVSLMVRAMQADFTSFEKRSQRNINKQNEQLRAHMHQQQSAAARGSSNSKSSTSHGNTRSSTSPMFPSMLPQTSNPSTQETSNGKLPI